MSYYSEYFDKSKSLFPVTKKENVNYGRGLINIGNSCFLNSVIQALAVIDRFKTYISNLNREEFADSTIQLLNKSLKEITEDKDSRPIQPAITKDKYIYERFLALKEQQDAHEFLIFVLDQIETVITKQLKNRRKNYIQGRRNDIFSLNTRETIKWDNIPLLGKMDSSLHCRMCGNTWSTTQNIFNLSLYPPYNGTCTLIDCLAAFTMSELVKGVYCPTCKKKRTVEKRLTLSKTPEILCIHFNRLSFSRSLRKIDTKIQFERNLDISFVTNHYSEKKKISKYLIFPQSYIEFSQSLETKEKENNAKQINGSKMNGHPQSNTLNGYKTANGDDSYKTMNGVNKENDNLSDSSSTTESGDESYILTSVIVHIGNHSGGHYICYRAIDPLSETSPWVMMSDTNLRLVKFEDVKKQEAFMLFYQKAH